MLMLARKWLNANVSCCLRAIYQSWNVTSENKFRMFGILAFYFFDARKFVFFNLCELNLSLSVSLVTWRVALRGMILEKKA